MRRGHAMAASRCEAFWHTVPDHASCFFLAGWQRTEDFQQCNSTSLEISMRNKVIIIAGFVFACGATIAPSFAADSPATKEITAADLAKSKPTATFEIEGKQLRLLVGGATGKGVLRFQGKNYPFTAKGASVGGAGFNE